MFVPFRCGNKLVKTCQDKKKKKNNKTLQQNKTQKAKVSKELGWGEKAERESEGKGHTTGQTRARQSGSNAGDVAIRKS